MASLGQPSARDAQGGDRARAIVRAQRFRFSRHLGGVVGNDPGDEPKPHKPLPQMMPLVESEVVDCPSCFSVPTRAQVFLREYLPGHGVVGEEPFRVGGSGPCARIDIARRRPLLHPGAVRLLISRRLDAAAVAVVTLDVEAPVSAEPVVEPCHQSLDRGRAVRRCGRRRGRSAQRTPMRISVLVLRQNSQSVARSEPFNGRSADINQSLPYFRDRSSFV